VAVDLLSVSLASAVDVVMRLTSYSVDVDRHTKKTPATGRTLDFAASPNSTMVGACYTPAMPKPSCKRPFASR
jgi:hypothetical protein